MNGIITVAVDVTARVVARRELARSEERFRALVDASAQIVWSADAKGDAIDSPSWRAFTGQSIEDCRAFGWLDAVHPEDRDRVSSLWREAVAQPAPAEAEYRIRHVSGEWRWTMVRATPLVDPDGAVREWIGMNADITDRKQAVEELERAVRFSEIFVGILSHDLRNPLGAISMAAKLLEHGVDSGEVARLLARIHRSTRRMERMISHLLDFTHVRLGGGIPLELTNVNLKAVCLPVIEELESSTARSIRVDWAGDASGVWDRDRLEQLVSNLVANACQHGTPDTPVQVLVDGGEADLVRLEVRNQGAIPKSLISTIFEPMRLRRENEGRQSSSSGLRLGLYITEQIVSAHGGTIDVKSSPSEGTRFVVELPRRSSGDTGAGFVTGAWDGKATGGG